MELRVEAAALQSTGQGRTGAGSDASRRRLLKMTVDELLQFVQFAL